MTTRTPRKKKVIRAPHHDERPARAALHMILLGYQAEYVAMWLWHMSRIEADIGAPDAVPEVWQ